MRIAYNRTPKWKLSECAKVVNVQPPDLAQFAKVTEIRFAEAAFVSVAARCLGQLMDISAEIEASSRVKIDAAVDLCMSFATSLAFYRSQEGLSLENSEKSPKRGLSAPGSKQLKKSRKRDEKRPKTRKKLEKESFSTLFRVFSTPGPRGPGNPFVRLFSEFFRERPF